MAVDRAAVLAQDFHADGALPGDDVRVVVGMHESELLAPGDLQRVRVGLVVGVAEQHHPRAARRHGRDLDLRRGRGHDDGGAAAQVICRQRHALRMIARRGGDHAAFALGSTEVSHLVVCAAQLEGEHRLHVLALEQQGIAEPGATVPEPARAEFRPQRRRRAQSGFFPGNRSSSRLPRFFRA